MCLIFFTQAKNKAKHTSKFEIASRACQQKGSPCENVKLDDSCVFKCLSELCFNKIYNNYVLEFGEVNYNLKSQFEACWNSIK